MGKKVLLAVLAVIVLVVVIFACFAIGSYNTLVGQRQNVDAQWAQVQNMMQRRADLIPNLVATVKGIAGL